MKIGEAKQIVAGLSFPTKMPGSSYGLPIRACAAGAILAKIDKTSCGICYAGKDQYSWPNARKAQERRLASLDDPRWVEAMIVLLAWTHRYPFRRIDLGLRPGPKLAALGSRTRLNEMGFHRWHDSGDLQSAEHLAKIAAVAAATPKIKHWLPTQELRFVKAFLDAGGAIPPNLLIRASTVMIDDHRPRAWPHGASVSRFVPAPTGAHLCPAPRQEHQCKSCRACWNPEVAHVVYEVH